MKYVAPYIAPLMYFGSSAPRTISSLVQTTPSGDVSGDSGGPWYNASGEAVGIHSGSGAKDPVSFLPGNSYFSTVQNAEAALNVTLKQ